MASFDEHIAQAKKNLNFLNDVNQNIPSSWDWQVTVCFYTAVHLVNAHLANKASLHYRSHSEVNNALNPFNIVSITKFNEREYTAYIKLQGLARRARYLCHQEHDNHDMGCHITFDKHFAKAVKNLDILIDFFKTEYGLSFDVPEISCMDLKSFKSPNFVIA